LEGAKAKAMVREEFIDTMKCLDARCKAALAQATGDPTITPLYVYDNVALQKGAKMSDMGLSRHQHVETPQHSPDFNKPIEHCWNQLKKKLLTKVYQAYDAVVTPELAQTWVLEAWNEIDRAAVARDVKSLEDTWSIIKTPSDQTFLTSKKEKINGSEGDYPPSAKYR
jgi:transposase